LATSLRATLPDWGAWFVDASIDGEHAITGAANVKLADLTLTGSVLSGGPDKGRSHFRIVAGRGGWAKEIQARSYADDGGVRLATVLVDAAAECGESLDVASVPSVRIGPAFVRPRGPASRVLEMLAPANWHIDELGTTKLGKRATGALPIGVTIGIHDKARGAIELASDSVKSILPGVVVEGMRAVDVLHEATPEGALRTRVWGAGTSATSRSLAAWRKLFEALDPSRKFRGVYEYRVVLQNGKRLDLQPVRVSAGMPSLLRVPVWPGVSGCDSDVILGSRVLVNFIDSDPSRPYVCALEETGGEGFKPLALRIDAATTIRLGAGALPVARATDMAGIYPITTTQIKVLA
jgi:hypothetical protein